MQLMERDNLGPHAYEPTREVAMAAFAKSWRGRELAKAGR
jgi:hypothetical protein